MQRVNNGYGVRGCLQRTPPGAEDEGAAPGQSAQDGVPSGAQSRSVQTSPWHAPPPQPQPALALLTPAYSHGAFSAGGPIHVQGLAQGCGEQVNQWPPPQYAAGWRPWSGGGAAEVAVSAACSSAGTAASHTVPRAAPHPALGAAPVPVEQPDSWGDVDEEEWEQAVQEAQRRMNSLSRFTCSPPGHLPSTTQTPLPQSHISPQAWCKPADGALLGGPADASVQAVDTRSGNAAQAASLPWQTARSTPPSSSTLQLSVQLPALGLSGVPAPAAPCFNAAPVPTWHPAAASIHRPDPAGAQDGPPPGALAQRGPGHGAVCADPVVNPALHRLGPHQPVQPRCPHASCPGVYRPCGAPLVWRARHDVGCGGLWGCSLYPDCSYVYWPHEVVTYPQLAMEVASPTHFKVLACLGAEDAVRDKGGVLAVLRRAGVDLRLMARSTRAPKAHSSGNPTAGPAAQPVPASVTQPVFETASASTAAVSEAKHQESDIKDSVMFPLAAYPAVEARLRAYKRNLLRHGSCIPAPTLLSYRGVLQTLRGQAEVDEALGRMPAALRGALMPFQLEGVVFGLRRHGRVLIADEMGVGKTLQALALAACYQEEWPLLAIVPASMRMVWAEEVEHWMPHIRPSQVHVIEGKAGRLAPLPAPGVTDAMPRVTIVSYEMMKRLTCDGCCRGRVVGCGGVNDLRRQPCKEPLACMASLPWGVVIIDESHNLRTTTHRAGDLPHTEACCAAAARARRAVMLTGTPSLTRPYDLYRQVDALRPGLLGANKEAFGDRYCNRRIVPCTFRGRDAKRYDTSGGMHLYELHGLLRREVMIRRLKQEVLAQLPPKRRSVVRLPHPPADRWPSGGPALGEEDDSEAEEAERVEGHARQPGSTASAAPVQGPGAPAAEPDVDTRAGAGEQAVPAPDTGMTSVLTRGPRDVPSKMTLEHRTALAKLPDVLEWLCNALEGSLVAAHVEGDAGDDAPTAGQHQTAAKFLVFAHHKDVMDALAAELLTRVPLGVSKAGVGGAGPGIPFVRIDGSHSSDERRDAVRRFHADPTVRVALLSITAASVGLDFSPASVVVFVELPHEIALVQQAEDRAHRKGATKAVNVYFLVAKGTSDERRWQRLNSSLSSISMVQDGPCGGPDAGNGPDAATGADGLPAGMADAGDGRRRLLVDAVVDVGPGAWRPPHGSSKTENETGNNAFPPPTSDHAATDSVGQAVASTSQPQQLEAGPPAVGPPTAKPTDDGDGVPGAGTPAATPRATASHPEVIDLCSQSPGAGRKDDGQPSVPSQQEGACAQVLEVPSAALQGIQPLRDAIQDQALRGNASDAVQPLPNLPAASVPAWGQAAARHGRQRGPGRPTRPSPAQQRARSRDCGAEVDGALLLPMWFEVSGHTGRLHLHLAPDGSRPLGLNVSVEVLINPDSLTSLTNQLLSGYTAVLPSLATAVAPALPRLLPFVKQRAVERPGDESQQGEPGSQMGGSHAPLSQLLHDRLRAGATGTPRDADSAPAGPPGRAGGNGTAQANTDGQQALGPEVLPVPAAADFQAAPAVAAILAAHTPGFLCSAGLAAVGPLVLAMPTPPHDAAAVSAPPPRGKPGDPCLPHPAVTETHTLAAGLGRGALSSSAPGEGDALNRTVSAMEPRPPAFTRPDQATPPGSPGATSPTACGYAELRQVGSTSASDISIIPCTPLDAAPHSPTSWVQRASESPPRPLQSSATAMDAACEVRPAVAMDGVARLEEPVPTPPSIVLVAQPLTLEQLAEAVGEAARFAREWRELRAVTCNRLQGRVLTACLQDAVEVAHAEALATGAYGSSTARSLRDAALPPPPGAEWRTVYVRSARPGSGAERKQLQQLDVDKRTGTARLVSELVAVTQYQQAFHVESQARLCLMCNGSIKGAPPGDAVLPSVSALFCCAACEDKYWVKASNGAIRRRLGKLEGGVCVACGLDCRALVRALQAIRVGSKDWEQRRRLVLGAACPRLMERKYKALGDRLVAQASEGFAWNADHIIPVYKGGGLCELDNLRTLCVACHSDVTRAQARERREVRAREALRVRDIRTFLTQPQLSGDTAPVRGSAAPGNAARGAVEQAGGGGKRRKTAGGAQALKAHGAQLADKRSRGVKSGGAADPPVQGGDDVAATAGVGAVVPGGIQAGRGSAPTEEAPPKKRRTKGDTVMAAPKLSTAGAHGRDVGAAEQGATATGRTAAGRPATSALLRALLKPPLAAAGRSEAASPRQQFQEGPPPSPSGLAQDMSAVVPGSPGMIDLCRSSQDTE